MEQVVTMDLAKQIERVEIDSFYSRLTRIKMIENNPMAVEIKKFGNATAFTVQNIPGPAFNKIKGMMDEDLLFLNEIIQLYRDKGIPARFEITPAHATSLLYRALAKQGFYHTDFLSNLYEVSPSMFPEEEDSTVSIREFKGNEFDLFAELYIDAFDMPDFLMESIALNNQVLHDTPEWKFYLASYNGIPAGIGVLYIGRKGAYLAAAGTIPYYRNKGIQSALIRHRINVAVRHNCELIVGQAKFGSGSQNNMERAGLKIAYTKSVWNQ